MHWRWRALGAALLVAALLLAERADGAPKRRRQKIGRTGEDEADSNAIDSGGSGRGLSEKCNGNWLRIMTMYRGVRKIPYQFELSLLADNVQPINKNFHKEFFAEHVLVTT